MQRIIASILIQWLLIGNASTAFSLPVEASTLSPEINLSQADVRGQFSQAQTVRSEQRIISWPKERKILNVPAVSASLLDVNPADLPMMSREAWRAGLEYYHIDHMDGNFVSNRVDGLAMMRVLREVDYGSIFDYADQEKAKRRPLFDAHLMVSDVSEG
jgi:Pentose-5-phosphate-3-epimerase